MAVATDNFAGTGTLGPNWTSLFNPGASTMARLAGQCNPGIQYDYLYWNADAFGNDHYSQFLFVGTATSGDGDGYTGLLVRAQGTLNAGSGYFLDLHSADSSPVYRIVTGSFTSIASNFTTPVNGQTLKLDVTGSTLTYYINGSQVNQITGETGVTTGGAPGIVGFKSTSNLFLDDWEGGPIAAGGGVVKTVEGNAIASNKTIQGLVVASVKTLEGAAYQ